MFWRKENLRMNKKEQAYDLIKERIIDSTYPSQSFIDEKLIAEELQASRTPVREAFIALSQDGYLQIRPKRGVQVIPFTDRDVMAIFDVRELVEPWLVQQYGLLIPEEELILEKTRIVEEVNYNFLHGISQPGVSMDHHPHLLFIEKCSNKYVQSMIRLVKDQSRRAPDAEKARAAEPMSEQERDDNINRHTQILDALLKKDLSLAIKLTQQHVTCAREKYMRYWFG